MTIWTDSYLKLAANTFSWHSQKIAFKEGLNRKATGSAREAGLMEIVGLWRNRISVFMKLGQDPK